MRFIGRFNKALIAFFTLILVFSCHFSFAQGEGNNWYFGTNAGIRFTDSGVEALTDGALVTTEGCATISSPEGDLLFYTDGQAIWDRNHDTMPNGSGLLGHPSSTSSAVIVGVPGSTTHYIVFTVDVSNFQGTDGFNYSEVDMTLNGGLGDVVPDKKNVFLFDEQEEKLTAVNHANGVDKWVIITKQSSNEFYAYEVTSAGVNPNPVISSVGIVRNGKIGYLKGSPNGQYLLLTNYDPLVEVYRFDNNTGIVSEPIRVNVTKNSYGCEFSPNSERFYITANSANTSVVQYSLTNYDSESINNSADTIHQEGSGYGALQLGPDGNIYVARSNSSTLDVIEMPNLTSSQLNYEKGAIDLSSGICRLGLPTFDQTFFINGFFSTQNTCVTEPTQFTIGQPSNPDSVFWNFGDPASGANNFSELLNPTHTFTGPGSYTVELVFYLGSLVDTVTQTVTINDLPEIELGLDTSVCEGEELLLDATTADATYSWQDGSSQATLTTLGSGIFWVDVTVNGCTARDSIKVVRKTGPDVDLGDEVFLCEGLGQTLNAFSAGSSYLWSTGSTDSAIVVETTGTVWVEVTGANDCISSDTVDVSIQAFPVVDLGQDTILCNTDSIVVSAEQAGATYTWNDGSIASFIEVEEGGIYWVDVSLNGCATRDSIEIIPTLVIELGQNIEVCDGEPVTLQAPEIEHADYLWSTGASSTAITVDLPTTYSVEILYRGCIYGDAIAVENISCIQEVPNVFSPNGDGRNDFFEIPGIEFRNWNLQVLNRWGNVVFESQAYRNDWDGGDLSEGVYFYLLWNEELDLSYTGNVQIIR